MFNFRTLLLTSFVLFSSMLHAAIIPTDTWHDDTDAFAGLKQSSHSANFFYAVSASPTGYSVTDTYEIMDGYRQATFAEYQAEMTVGDAFSLGNPYYNQGGWNGYNWNNHVLHIFTFVDTEATGMIVHAGGDESADWSLNYSIGYIHERHNYWAGLVLIRDASAAATVDEPSIVALLAFGLFGIGLARRKIKK